MVTRTTDKNIYFTKGLSRKRQIYNWLDDVVKANGLFFFYQDIFTFTINQEFDKAFKRFVELIDFIIDTRPSIENGDILGYLIGENIKYFGRKQIIADLFNGVITPKIRARGLKKQKIPKQVRTAKVEDLQKEYKQKKTSKYYLGITKKGERKRGNLEIYITKEKKTLYILRDEKTGRFLKKSKSLKNEIRKRQ